MQQTANLKDNPGVKLVLGTSALGIDTVEACLRECVDKTWNIRVFKSTLPALKSILKNRLIALLMPGCQWSTADLAKMDESIRTIEESSRPVVLALCDEECE